MKILQIVIAALAGAIVVFLLGWLFYGVILFDFMSENASLSHEIMEKINKPQEEISIGLIFLSNLALGLLLSLIIYFSGFTSLAKGALAGAAVGFLLSLNVDLSFLSMTYLISLKMMLADLAIYTIMSAISGGVIAIILAAGRK